VYNAHSQAEHRPTVDYSQKDMYVLTKSTVYYAFRHSHCTGN